MQILTKNNMIIQVKGAFYIMVITCNITHNFCKVKSDCRTYLRDTLLQTVTSAWSCHTLMNI